MKDEIVVRIRPKRWWSIRAWKKARVVQSLDNWVLQQLLQRKSLRELLRLDWKGLEKEIEKHILEEE